MLAKEQHAPKEMKRHFLERKKSKRLDACQRTQPSLTSQLSNGTLFSVEISVTLWNKCLFVFLDHFLAIHRPKHYACEVR